MIIPVKCFTCGTVIGDKYKYFINEVAKQKKENDIDDKIQYLDTNQKIERTIEGKVLDQLNLRRILLQASYVDAC